MAEAKIVQDERRDKRKPRFRFDYAEPQPIFVPTKIAKGECRDKRKFYFRFDYAEPHPIFVLTKITNQLCNIGNTADKNKTDSPRNLQQSGK